MLLPIGHSSRNFWPFQKNIGWGSKGAKVLVFGYWNLLWFSVFRMFCHFLCVVKKCGVHHDWPRRDLQTECLWHLWRASTIRWDPRTKVMKIIWRIMIKKWEKSYYLMIMTVIMIPSLTLLSLTPVEDSLVILTPPMSICQYFAKNDALQQKQCIATFFGKSLWISYPLSLSQKIIWSYKRPIIYLSLLENQAVCKRASASHQRNITATPHATHNIQIDYGKSVPWVHLE